jgi:hypothetical protein
LFCCLGQTSVNIKPASVFLTYIRLGWKCSTIPKCSSLSRIDLAKRFIVTSPLENK